MYNNISSLDVLLEYYNNNKSFEKLRNCGRKSNEELIEVCEKYLASSYFNEDANIKKLQIDEIVQNLTRIQREVINSFIFVNTSSLSVRSKNAISQFFDGNFNVRNFAEKILLNKKFIVATIDNIGKKSIPEIEIYISIVKDFIFDVQEISDEKQLITLKNNFLIQRTFSISKIPSEILQSESIFQLTDFLLKGNAFFNETHNSIIQKALKIYKSSDYEIINNAIVEKDVEYVREYSTEEIANLHNLSRERVRQIRKDCLNILFEKLSFIRNFKDDLFQNYGLDISRNIIDIDKNLTNEINIKSKTNFSSEFISYILAVYLCDNFCIVGNIEDILLPKYSNSRNRHNWKYFFIVKKELAKVDFTSFADDISERLNERIEETYSFNLKSYIAKFINNLDIEILDLAFPIAEKILFDEFALSLDIDDNIVFKKNTIKQAFEYSFEALEKLGKPSKVEEITQKIIELHPNYKTDEYKVRISMKRKDGFVPVGRESVFGLKKWEKELDDFKGGTIRSITVEFLERFETPKHISLISEYISNYREGTYQRSIIDNLKADKSNSFIFLRQGFLGLNSLKEKYNINKYQNLPVQFGKTLISLNRKGYSKQQIINYIKSNYNLNEEESSAIINNLEI
ncbi:hypothetical protein EG338_07390 [Kaistella haifensis]|nr:hypothetical protein EG338_07390 [Kaistella haifensis]